jgi:outer membrane protein, multidrug efflux system
MRILEEQEVAQNKAVEAARRTADISISRYKEGLAEYIEVIDAERDVLSNEQAAAQLREQRLLTSAQLIQALGGGWEESKVNAPVPNKVDANGNPPVNGANGSNGTEASPPVVKN